MTRLALTLSDRARAPLARLLTSDAAAFLAVTLFVGGVFAVIGRV